MKRQTTVAIVILKAESLEDGTPAYYNSNVLGKVLRKIILIMINLLAPFLFTPTKDISAETIPVIPYVATWKCPDCNENEQYVLEQIQKHTKITDRNAFSNDHGKY